MPDRADLRGKDSRGDATPRAAAGAMPASVEDEFLMRRLAAGDEEAFVAFYARHQRAIYRYALHMSGRSDMAEEVVQEAFMTLMRAAGKFDAARGAPQAFLFGIARNHLRRRTEAEGRYVSLPAEFPGESSNGNGAKHPAALQISTEQVFHEFSRAEIADRVRRAVLLLPEHYREAVTLCDLQGLDYAAAARALECPIGTVRSRLARAREMLTAKLRPVRPQSSPAVARTKE